METEPLLTSNSSPADQQHQLFDNHNQHRSYDDATNNRSSNRELLSTTAGRGKERFNKRQQMKLKQQLATTSAVVGIYDTIFASKQSRNTTRLANVRSKQHQPDIITTSSNFNNKSAKARPTTPKSRHTQLYTILNPKSKSPHARLFQTTISTIIILDALIYIISTEPHLQHSHERFFYFVEGITSTIFLMELIARVVVCTEKKCYAKYGPIGGRWRYLCSFQGIIDSFATLPFFVEWMTGIDLPTLTYLRVFRLMRITRTRSYVKAVEAVGRVLYFNREILHVAALLGVYLVVVTSVLMYYLRPRGVDVDGVDDISDFESISSTMVLSIMMLTGQGGPSGKLPWYTQSIVLVTGMFSVAMFAIPASMLTWGFEAEAQRLGMKAKRRAMAKRKGEVYVDMSSSSSSNSGGSSDSCISTSDEEYMNIIGGGDEDENGEGISLPGKTSDWSKLDATGAVDILQTMQTRIEQLEMKLSDTNAKLDRILAKLD